MNIVIVIQNKILNEIRMFNLNKVVQ